MTIRGRLFLLVAVAAIPLLLFMAGLVLWQGATLRSVQMEQAARMSDGSMQAIDAQIASAITGLQVLAASPSLLQPDLRAFHDQATAAIGIASDSVIILYDPEGNRLLSTAVPYGEPVPQRKSHVDLDPALASGDVHVTPLFVSETSGKMTIGIVVPVILQGRVRYLISAGLLSQTLSAEIARQRLPPGWITSVLDQRGTIVARSTAAESAVGRQAVRSNWDAIRASGRQQASFNGVTLEGVPMLLTFTRSANFGWTTVVAIPPASLNAQTVRSLSLVAVAGSLVLLLASALAWYSAKRIYVATDTLVGAASAMEEGRPVAVLHSGIRQFDHLAAAFSTASSRIAERERDLSRSLLELREAHDRMRDEQQKKDEFIATLAHELRNPLAPIRTGVHLLKRSRDEALVARTLAMMGRQVDHMVRLIDDLMDVSRISRGKVVLQRSIEDLRTVVSQTMESNEPLLAAAGLQCSLQLPPEPVWVSIDAVRIAQVLGNVLANAAKFTPRDGRVDVRLSSDAGSAAVEVADTGIGIAADRIERIFELFAQERVAGGPVSGLGIGLSIARTLVEMHGGTLTARSEGVGRGATFSMRLSTLTEPQMPPARDPAPPAAPSPRRLLVVDDNADAADVLAASLQAGGHTVHVAHGGDEALGIAARTEVDIVLLDLGMPGMDGYEVCRRLRLLPRYARARIVALTGWGSEGDRALTARSGFDAHLVKPVDWSELAKVLAGCSG